MNDAITEPNIYVRLATTENVDTSTSTFSGVIDGVSPQDGDVILFRHQDDPSQNGLYTLDTGAFERTQFTPDSYNFNVFPGSFLGTLVSIQDGYTFGGSVWLCRNHLDDGSNLNDSSFPILFTNLNPLFWKGAKSDDGAACTTTLQEHLDTLLDFSPIGETYRNNVWAHQDLLITPAHNSCVVRCYDIPSATLTVTLPSSPSSSIDCVIVQCGWNAVPIQIIGGVPIATLTRRYETVHLSYLSGTWTPKTDDVPYPAGIGFAKLGPGTFDITGDGIKLHPLVSMEGSGEDVTVLRATPDLVGKQDSLTPSPGALLTIMARVAPEIDTFTMSQPTVGGITFLGSSEATNVAGCIAEPGLNDPNYPNDPPGSKKYDSGSVNLYDVAFYSFTSYGVYAGTDRQRFHAMNLKCLSNGDHALNLRGNDCVVGAGCVLGASLAGFGFYAQNISGVLVNGVRFSASPSRSEGSLAAHIFGTNGASLTDCIFNDTVLVDSLQNDGDIAKGVSFAGCIFEPDAIFDDNGDPQWIGGGDSDFFDCFIRVAYNQNVRIAGCSFSPNTSPSATIAGELGGGVFSFHVIADNGANVSYGAPMIPSGTGKNFKASSGPCIANSTTDPNASVVLSGDDVQHGRKYSCALIAPSTVSTVVRGIASLQAFDGYTTVDAGPMLRLYGEDFEDQSGAYVHVADAGETGVNIEEGVRYFVLILPAGSWIGYVINLQPSPTRQNHFSIRVKINVTGIHTTSPTVAWKVNGSPIVMADNDILPTTLSSHQSYELLWRGTPSDQKFYILDKSV